MDDIGEAIKQAATEAIVPRFRSLAVGDVHEKSPGDVVTVADRECERLLEVALADLAPGVAVLGEEAAAADPGLSTERLGSSSLFVVDPLDGTREFVAGSPDFAVMVARVDDGVTTAAWIWHPMYDVMWTARLGEGAFRNDVRLTRPPAGADPSTLHGAVKLGFVDPDRRANLADRFDRFGSVVPGPAAAGFVYPSLVSGDVDFALFWRMLPWDHAPGALIAEEAACVVRRLDGSPYRVAESGVGLLSAAGAAAWEAARAGLWDE